MAIHGDLLLEAWMDPGNPGNPGNLLYAIHKFTFEKIRFLHNFMHLIGH